MTKIAVVGTGIMGRGIALAAAQAGLLVVWASSKDSSRASAGVWLDGQLSGLVSKGKLTPEAAQAVRDRLFIATFGELTATNVAGVELAIEAITEDLALKSALMAKLSDLMPEATALATNTSSLSVADLAGASGTPERVVGLHFFNPVHAMPIVELVVPPLANDAAIECARAFAARLGKTAIRVADAGGFVVNRALFAMLNEACRLVDDGVALVADVDVAIKGGLGHPMGPFALMDLIGLDTCVAILESLTYEHGPRFRPAVILGSYVKAGRLGRKTGQGFFSYP